MATKAQALNFLTKAKVTELKNILEKLGLSRAGEKAILKSRLIDQINAMTDDEILETFPIVTSEERDNETDNDQTIRDFDNGIAEEDEESTETESNGSDEEDIQQLKAKIKRLKKIAKLKEKLRELEENTSKEERGPQLFSFRDIEDSIHSFSGDDNYRFSNWLSDFEDTAKLMSWNEQTKFIYARRSLKGTAKLFMRSKPSKNWKELKEALTSEFGKKVRLSDIYRKLENRKKRKDESCQQYLLAMQEIASAVDISEEELIDYIVEGIPDSQSNKSFLYQTETIENLKKALHRYERIKSRSSTTEANNSKSKATVNEEKASQKSSYNGKGQNSKIGPIRCFNCGELGHLSKNCKKPQRERGSCYRCKKMGHKGHECPELTSSSTSASSSVLSIERDRSGNAPRQQAENGRLGDNQAISNLNLNLSNEFEFKIRYQFGRDDKKFDCELQTLLDSGSPISIIKEDFVPKCLWENSKEDNRYHGINRSPVCILSSVNVCIEFNGLPIDMIMYIVKNDTMILPSILGRDFLKKAKFGLVQLDIVSSEKKDDEVTKNIHEGIVAEKSTKCDMLPEIFNIDIAYEGNNCELDVCSKIPLDIGNEIRNIVGKSFESRDIDKLIETDFEMTIRLTKTEPFFSAPRRLPFSQKQVLQGILDDLIDRKIIRESHSPYASPIVLVQKKNKEARLCIDYRELNKHTVRENFPLPLIEDLLDQLR